MRNEQRELSRPIRVVLFCGGPTLDRAVLRFAALLDEHPEIELVGGFCQSSGQSIVARAQDRWRRRGFLGVPLLLLEAFNVATQLLSDPRLELSLRDQRARITRRIQFVPDIHTKDVLENVQALDPDLGVIYGAPILKPKLFQIPRLGTLGIHHGKVPEYRGKKTTFWSVFNGERHAGVTIQRINAGVDTGDVIEKGLVLIERKSVGQVSRELQQLGFELYIQAIVAIKRGTAQAQPQAGTKGKLYKDPKVGDILRLWGKQLAWKLV